MATAKMNPADNPAEYLQSEIERLAKFVAQDLHEQILKAYPKLDIDNCEGQVYAIAHRNLFSKNRDFADRVLDEIAQIVAIDPVH